MASIKNICRVQNFIGAAELGALTTFCSTNKYLNSTTTRAILQADNETEISSWVREYTQKVGLKITEFFGTDVVDCHGTALRNWNVGERQDPHSDCEAIFFQDEFGSISMTPINNFSSIFIEYAALTYLNDDYEGGEIYFPNFDLQIKPLPGELIFFPGTQHYMHGVNEIIAGNRYALMTFFTTPKIKYIWKTFVQDQSEIVQIDRGKQESMTTTDVFTRKTMPKHFFNLF